MTPELSRLPVEPAAAPPARKSAPPAPTPFVRAEAVPDSAKTAPLARSEAPPAVSLQLPAPAMTEAAAPATETRAVASKATPPSIAPTLTAQVESATMAQAEPA